jgi:hypothetical protein
VGVLALAIAASAVASLAACDSGARSDAQRLASAVERYRRADNPSKPSTIDAIRSAPCSADDVCRAKAACLATAEPTAKALTIQHEVEVALRALDAGTLPKDSPKAKGLFAKVDAAEALLNEGHGKLTACDDQILALKQKYRF